MNTAGGRRAPDGYGRRKEGFGRIRWMVGGVRTGQSRGRGGRAASAEGSRLRPAAAGGRQASDGCSGERRPLGMASGRPWLSPLAAVSRMRAKPPETGYRRPSDRPDASVNTASTENRRCL